MKFIILNRKRIGVTIIIIGLMLILFGFEKNFDNRLKNVVLIQNSVNSLLKYEVPELKFNYKLPSEWKTQKQSFYGNEILYHNDFNSEDAVIHGFVQVWNMKGDLKNFLDKSKNSSAGFAQYTEYSIEPINIKGHEGYLVIYTMKTSENANFKAYEYFLKDKDKFVRFAFYVRDKNFKENMAKMFEVIVETFENY
ncbi:hypothetical protein SAMN05428976_105105 [Clostridium sp. USBA 49]|uniref:PsbP-related protein n=1 Tax=Clostridium sp. USBA 49 TaxID=1881060 RepID=UPI000999BB84|nr:PsbP-related protein [Clostridium sp. USBA 49]SKA82777.1 hypothetical protein SAMN05428976_105105 [Clostridium sp. USBA 49]